MSTDTEPAAEPGTAYVLYGNTVCVSRNGRRMNANELYKRLIKKYGPASAEKPNGAAFFIRLDPSQIHSVLTREELGNPPIIPQPCERMDLEEWHAIPLWARSYIEQLEKELD